MSNKRLTIIIVVHVISMHYPGVGAAVQVRNSSDTAYDALVAGHVIIHHYSPIWLVHFSCWYGTLLLVSLVGAKVYLGVSFPIV